VVTVETLFNIPAFFIMLIGSFTRCYSPAAGKKNNSNKAKENKYPLHVLRVFA
jgi:hypothetical protein